MRYVLEVRYFDKPLYGREEPSLVTVESFDTTLGFKVEGCGNTYEEALEDFKAILAYHRKSHQEEVDIQESRAKARIVLEEVDL